MRLYPDGRKVNERLSQIAPPLRKKFLDSYDEAAEKRGFRMRGTGQDDNGHYVEVDIKPGTSVQQVYEFINDVDTAAVTVEPKDFTAMLGRSIQTLSMQRNLEIHGAQSTGLELIEPDELANSLVAHRLRSMDGKGIETVDAEAAQFIEQDLVAQGLLTEDEIRGNEQWESVRPELTEAPTYEDLGSEWVPEPDDWDGE